MAKFDSLDAFKDADDYDLWNSVQHEGLTFQFRKDSDKFVLFNVITENRAYIVHKDFASLSEVTEQTLSDLIDEITVEEI